jgi:hypothetical protein
MATCADCQGSGQIDCPHCKGTGYDGRDLCTACESATTSDGQLYPSGKVRCRSCGGAGKR